MVDSGEPRTLPRVAPKLDSGSVPLIKWPERPVQEPIIGVNIGIPQERRQQVSKKSEPYSIAEAPSAKVSEERRLELRNMGLEIAAKKLGLLDEGGIVDGVKALRSEERGFTLVAYANSIVDGSVRGEAGPVERQKECQHILSEVSDLVRISEETKKHNSSIA